ncbi:hypothetical protein [Pantoea sp. GbtcB22]|uniref:hypothetical protein n=1 Tax=Pantoea sp. GbtcB22 TaxID=2824767 RepID=UPI001C30E865|nr:hypothetical protein [Pantoea sp. GbtcB22]
MNAEKLNQLIDLADKYDYKPDEIHRCNLNEFVAGNASLISAMCKDYSALQQKLDAVLAENVALKSPEMVEFLRLVECMTGDHADSNYGASHEWIRHIFAQGQSFEEKYGDTPWGVTSKSKYVATDAILNEVRAEGVEMFAAEREELRKHYVAKKDREMAVSADHCAMAAFAFAEELRARKVGGANHD